jgi:hypothetical protein
VNLLFHTVSNHDEINDEMVFEGSGSGLIQIKSHNLPGGEMSFEENKNVYGIYIYNQQC